MLVELFSARLLSVIPNMSCSRIQKPDSDGGSLC